MIRAAAAALLLLAAAASPQTPTQRADRLLLDASRAVQAGSAPRFLGYFDRKRTPGFAELRRGIFALVEGNNVASSVEIRERTEADGDIELVVDWLLQITADREPGPVEQRRETVRVRVRVDEGGKAKLVGIEPISFFAPAPLLPPGLRTAP